MRHAQQLRAAVLATHRDQHTQMLTTARGKTLAIQIVEMKLDLGEN
jgi:hypothetical protein